MTDEARKQTVDEPSEDLDITDDTAEDVTGGTVSHSDLQIQKVFDKTTP